MLERKDYKQKVSEKTVLLSSSSFYHTTDSLDKIISIINKGFRPFYSMEQSHIIVNGNAIDINVGVPMICLSDLPLTLLKDNLKTYGGYAIGISYEWAKENGFSPVRYVDISSDEYHKSFEPIMSQSDVFKEIPWSKMALEYPKLAEYIPKIQNDSKRRVQLMKPYIADLYRDKLKIVHKNYNFYNEREWRYVPPISLDNDFEDIITCQDYADYLNQRESNELKLKSMTSLFLEFDLTEHLNYIIVKEEKDIDELFFRLGSSQFEQVLRGKILVTEKVLKDF